MVIFVNSNKYELVQTMGVRLLGGVPLIGIIQYANFNSFKLHYRCEISSLKFSFKVPISYRSGHFAKQGRCLHVAQVHSF